jgi:murein DD-endopeptidase MepM/ murein hydrolase activator NlpD
MFRSAKHFAGRNVVRFALIGLSGLWLSGCSTDATRLTDSMDHPFNNPFGGASNAEAAPTPGVTSRPLAAARTSGPNTAYIAPAHPSPVASAPLAEPAPATTGTLRAEGPAAVGGTAAGWTAVGGSAVLVLQGDTAESLGRRYGVPTPALLGANGLKSPSQVHSGMHIIVPIYNAQARSASSAVPIPTAEEPRHASQAVAKNDDAEDSLRAKARARKLAAREEPSEAVESPAAKAKAKRLASEEKDAETKPEKAESKKRQAEAADAPSGKGKNKKSEMEKTAEESSKTKADKKSVDLKTADVKNDKLKNEKLKGDKAKASENTKVASAKPEAPAKIAIDPTPTSKVASGGTTEAPKTSQEADASGANPEFRWPARGRIIQGFKSGGNDGINISVPEGTSVRAAESGVVAYAGSELKGYGNLVLIRHPNGFVTAYANNGEINVKRGEQVKRGQVIAKSGESGNVSAPQLHFELRDKSGSPVDPTNFLAGL